MVWCPLFPSPDRPLYIKSVPKSHRRLVVGTDHEPPLLHRRPRRHRIDESQRADSASGVGGRRPASGIHVVLVETGSPEMQARRALSAARGKRRRAAVLNPQARGLARTGSCGAWSWSAVLSSRCCDVSLVAGKILECRRHRGFKRCWREALKAHGGWEKTPCGLAASGLKSDRSCCDAAAL